MLVPVDIIPPYAEVFVAVVVPVAGGHCCVLLPSLS